MRCRASISAGRGWLSPTELALTGMAVALTEVITEVIVTKRAEKRIVTVLLIMAKRVFGGLRQAEAAD